MKKYVTGIIIAVMAILVLTVPAFAESKNSHDDNDAGPFKGVFRGRVAGDYGSKAFLTLNLTDRDYNVEGTASLGSGLKVNAGGFCGSASLPARSMWAEGTKSPKRPNELAIEAPIDVGGFEVTVEVEGKLSADGETLEVEATIDTPWVCGRDPVISGTLTRID